MRKLNSFKARARLGSLEDISERIRDVRFTPRSGHAQGRHRCLLSAISRRSDPPPSPTRNESLPVKSLSRV